jgi:hypothetical protein
LQYLFVKSWEIVNSIEENSAFSFEANDMRVSSINEYLTAGQIDQQEQEPIFAEFPHVVVVEGDYPEFDLAVRWCWTCFGPQHGECWSIQSEYPACPVVLATEHSRVRASPEGKTYEIKAYDRVAPHRHSGEWTVIFLEKTDYDHGFGEFCFRLEAHKDEFLQQVPKIDWGENFPWLRHKTN